MDRTLVLTVIGPDRPGIVEALSETIAAHHGSWRRSRMARLSGQFAGILEVAVDAARADAMALALTGLSSAQLSVTLTPTEDADDRPTRRLAIEVVGHDRPGIVRSLSQALGRRGVNVLELESECVPAPMSGEPMFQARCVAELPAGLALDGLREALEAVAGDLMVDLAIDDA